MISRIHTYTNIGLDGFRITIEADSSRALPGIEIVGLPDASIKEAKERIRATLRNTGIDLPPRRIILNLSPSDIKKFGTRFDLPMAVAILHMLQSDTMHHPELIENALFFGELGLDGEVKKVDGLLPSVISATKDGYTTIFCPAHNAREIAALPGLTIYPIAHFSELIDLFINGKEIKTILSDTQQTYTPTYSTPVDIGSIKWHAFAKRAITIAAAGLHNILMVWAPGSGKSMLAKAMQWIIPPMSYDEVIQVSQIYSIIGNLDSDNPLITQRPFRSVHHTASPVAITWWWSALTPGEISLAHKWILFFDELPEFPRQVLEVLRQPLEDRTITISRASGSVSYPAHIMFVAAMNPCPCGFYKDPHKQCSCSLSTIKRYQSKVSGPLLDRFDMIIEVPRETVDTILDSVDIDGSDTFRPAIESAMNAQQTRYTSARYTTNSELDPAWIESHIHLTDECQNFLKSAIEKLDLSPRVMHRLMKVSRTIADVDGVPEIAISHIAEALQYRSKGMFLA